MKIIGLDILRCPIELPQAIRFGEVEIRTRDYVVVQIRTGTGVVGCSVSYARGTPLLEAVAVLGPRILNQDALLRRKIVDSLQQSYIPGQASFVRAISAIDIALWDIAAKAAGLPLYRLLGGFRTEIPLAAVAGYFPESRSAESLETEIKALVDEGYGLIKMCLPGMDARADARLITRLVKAANGARLAVDAHWLWSNVNAARDACNSLDDLGLAFIEDPFPPNLWRHAAQLRNKLRTPLAAGEDATSLAGFHDLLESVDVLRVDATASGGITGALAAINLAEAGGRTVLPHVFLPLHSHLVAASPVASYAEFTTDPQVDPYARLLRSPVNATGGKMIMDEEPGNGWQVDWEAAVSLATQSATI